MGPKSTPEANPHPPRPPRYLGITELEAYLGISRCSVWRWTKLGAFPAAVWFGSRRAWLESDLEAWAASRSTQPPRAA